MMNFGSNFHSLLYKLINSGPHGSLMCVVSWTQYLTSIKYVHVWIIIIIAGLGLGAFLHLVLAEHDTEL